MLCASFAGCVGSKAEKEKQAGRLDACSEGASEEELQENIRISEEYAGSLGESLTIAWLPTLFAMDFVVLYAQTLNGAGGSPPPKWTYDAGVYRYGGTTASIELRVLLGEDSAYGPAGTPIKEDIFALGSYLEGATVTPNQSDETISIDYETPGPLVELLGFGPMPPDPLVLGPNDVQTIVDRLKKLELEPDYVSYGVTPLLNWDFHWKSKARSIEAIVGGDVPIDVELVAVNVTREDTGQSLTTEVWDVNQQLGNVNGYTTFTVSGGTFPFRGRVEFKSTPFVVVIPTRTLDCP